MKIILIRHGKTAGNLEKRYIGITDESLCDAGKRELAAREYPDCNLVVSSTMKRCEESAKIIYPEKKILLFSELNECDFGVFEWKNYSELSEDQDYQKWLNSKGQLPFPDGEDPEEFKERCSAGFMKIIDGCAECDTLSFVIHGGTIMSIMEKFALPTRGFYGYQVPNGGGYVAEWDGKNIVNAEIL